MSQGFIQSNVVVKLPLVSTGVASTTTVALQPADSGKIFAMPGPTVITGNILAIQLPAVAVSAGTRYKFIVASQGITGGQITIASPASATPACIRSVNSGNVTASGGSSATALTNNTTVTFSFLTAGTSLAVVGDTIDACCDGTLWYLSGQTIFVGSYAIV